MYLLLEGQRCIIFTEESKENDKRFSISIHPYREAAEIVETLYCKKAHDSYNLNANILNVKD